ncbi:AcrR family transcriptional regulator [Nocardioides luteus]|uniref:TetR family transcriptional regulator n=1 Tax=Nocardioides luteus TaxID=1844 RepID=A0ABQ5SPL2_9ACTN|nr:TetR/AcrR family transcriptional regulator [Nocardioides luteus]MDR7313024.1 AcrR family transcriptional regulator [Nocardioides luteus]GGR44590.1 TetR family transcriptional regulator [Nocardioides luteus]GLJ66085.1 TetR family transcriptional regulator [Nocardioides luteus]
MSQRPDDVHSRERILAAATTLFAERGYDATSTRAIADAVGLNIATVAYHVGSKPQLYREVMRRAHEAQRDVVLEALKRLETVDPTPAATVAGLIDFVDAYLAFCLDHREVPALWMRRWLSEGKDLIEFESDLAGPLIADVVASVRTALSRAGIDADVDVEMLVFTIVWTAHSFGQAGVIDASGNRVPPGEGAALDRFRAHLHTVIERMVPTLG